MAQFFGTIGMIKIDKKKMRPKVLECFLLTQSETCWLVSAVRGSSWS